MFTGFASENTPSIQVWDYFQALASASSIRRISLADDCAPIQYFRTGATTTTINLYLPSAPIEGKQIKIINSRYGGSDQSVSVFVSDRNAGGTSTAIMTIGQGQTLDFCYSKNFISFGTSVGLNATGWITLNQSPTSAVNYNSVIACGTNNTTSSTNTFVAAGSSNKASGDNCAVVGGSGNTASGFSCFIASSSSTASGTYSAVFGGDSNTSSGQDSVVIGGNNNTANSNSSAVVAGNYGSTRSIIANTVFPASNAPTDFVLGINQTAVLVLARQTTDATATRLLSSSGAASTTNQVILPNNSAYTFQGTCIANVTGGSTTSGWEFQGVIKRGANAASTALVAAVTPIVIAQDVAAATWVLAITADTTNGGIAVTVTGAAATTIRWVSKIETTEVTF